LAPLIVDRLLAAIEAARERGVGVLLVEQHTHKVLRVAAYVAGESSSAVPRTSSALDPQRSKTCT
jgi:ABC-type branched-subunit amino acid transport system ATPase component